MELWVDLIHPWGPATKQLFNHHSNLRPGDRRAHYYVSRLCFFIGRHNIEIEEVFEVFPPVTHNVQSQGQQHPIPIIHSVNGALLLPPESPDSRPESPQRQLEFILHGLITLLPHPSFCLSNYQSCIPLSLTISAAFGVPLAKKAW